VPPSGLFRSPVASPDLTTRTAASSAPVIAPAPPTFRSPPAPPPTPPAPKPAPRAAVVSAPATAPASLFRQPPYGSQNGSATKTAAPPAPTRTKPAKPSTKGPVGPTVAAPRRRRSRLLVEWAVVLLVAVGVAFGIRTFVAQTFYIPSASMEPTLMVGDRIVVDKLSYHLHAVHRGDIIVFGRPPGENQPGVDDLVKRVIGLPGDTVASLYGRVFINNKPLNEPWLPPGTVTTGITTQKIPPNEYFVMGDNRSDSQDSRFFGPISGNLIVGRVVVRIWPLSSVHAF
jgi:signal peptidase I